MPKHRHPPNECPVRLTREEYLKRRCDASSGLLVAPRKDWSCAGERRNPAGSQARRAFGDYPILSRVKRPFATKSFGAVTRRSYTVKLPVTN